MYCRWRRINDLFSMLLPLRLYIYNVNGTPHRLGGWLPLCFLWGSGRFTPRSASLWCTPWLFPNPFHRPKIRQSPAYNNSALKFSCRHWTLMYANVSLCPVLSWQWCKSPIVTWIYGRPYLALFFVCVFKFVLCFFLLFSSRFFMFLYIVMFGW